MGQWGKTYRVNGAEFLSHLDTGGAFSPARPDSTVDMFMLSSSSEDKERDKQTEYHLNKLFVGKPVSQLDDWYREYQDSAILHTERSNSPWSRIPEGSPDG